MPGGVLLYVVVFSFCTVLIFSLYSNLSSIASILILILLSVFLEGCADFCVNVYFCYIIYSV